MPKRKEGGIIGPTKKAALAAATKRTPAGAKTSAKAGTATRATKSTTRRRGKYNAAGERVDGHWFASAAEARRYLTDSHAPGRTSAGQESPRRSRQPSAPGVLALPDVCQSPAGAGHGIRPPPGRSDPVPLTRCAPIFESGKTLYLTRHPARCYHSAAPGTGPERQPSEGAPANAQTLRCHRHRSIPGMG